MLPGYRQEVISNSGLEAGFVLGHIPKGPELGSPSISSQGDHLVLQPRLATEGHL